MLDAGRLRLVVHPPSNAQTGADMTPVAEHVALAGGAYPASHVGWHVAPAARLLVHVPRPPLAGAVTLHGAYVGESVVGVAVLRMHKRP